MNEKRKGFLLVGILVIVLIAFFVFANYVNPDALKELGLELPIPLFTFIIGIIDGFNPCNLFVLTLLLGLLISASHSRKRILTVGFTFVVIVFGIYFAFMAAWLNIFKYIGFIDPLRIILGVVALLAGLINMKELFFFRKGFTLMIQEKHKAPLMKRVEKVKEVMVKGSMSALLGSAIVLAAFASLVELPCTAGFPIIYTGILSAKALTGANYYLYLLLYNVFYVVPLAVVISIFGFTLHSKKITPNQMGIIKFIGGAIMLLLGIILLVKPGLIGIG